MKVDISLKNAKVYDVEKIDVMLGEKFALSSDLEEAQDIFSNNDAVLSISAAGTGAEVEATALGEAKIFFMAGDTITKKLFIKVVSEFVEPANSLNAAGGEPVAK